VDTLYDGTAREEFTDTYFDNLFGDFEVTDADDHAPGIAN
jgi:hypothetical protein